MGITADQVKQVANECGFELAGITRAEPSDDFARFEIWRGNGYAGEMRYLTDHRGDMRHDPRALMAEAESIVCVGKLYNTAHPHTVDSKPESGWISRYAWGQDYHEIMREGLTRMAARIGEMEPNPFHWRACVDTAPLLERSYARAAGLGWIGKNTCLISQAQGSWFFLGELLLSIPLTRDSAPPDRCGTCTRCIEACPTKAIVPDGRGGWTLDARLCISYLTIEKRGPIDGELAARMQNHVFGCDICQDVCPWNARAGFGGEPRFEPAADLPGLGALAGLTELDFRELFRNSPVWRAKYEGFLRNAAIAMGNSGNPDLLKPLEQLAAHPVAVIAHSARQAIFRLQDHAQKGHGRVTPKGNPHASAV